MICASDRSIAASVSVGPRVARQTLPVVMAETAGERRWVVSINVAVVLACGVGWEELFLFWMENNKQCQDLFFTVQCAVPVCPYKKTQTNESLGQSYK